MRKKSKQPKQRSVVAEIMSLRKYGAGPHKNRDLSLKRGSTRKQKHKKQEPLTNESSGSSNLQT